MGKRSNFGGHTIPRFTAEGWQATPALDGTHHGEYLLDAKAAWVMTGRTSDGESR